MPSQLAPAPPLAVVVCAWTTARWATTRAALSAARQQADAARDEVVLVVDHDEELLALARAEAPDGVRVVASTGARGLSGARNTGTAATRADAVVFLDDDALPRPGWLAAVRERLRDPAVAVVAGAVHAAWEGGVAPRWFPPEYGWVVGCDYTGLAGHGQEVRNPIGASMAVRREVLEAVGGFSTDLGRVGALPAGCEETLMGIAVRSADPDARIVRDTGFAVDHHVPAARQRPGYFVRRCFHEGRSKGVLVRVAGAAGALSAERSYVAAALTSALAREVRRSARGDLAAAAAAAAVVTGVLVTGLGLVTSWSPGRRRPPGTGPSGAAPAAVAVIEARQPLGADELVTVVLCTLGVHPRLPDAVAGVLAQDHRHLQLIVVDNDPASGAARAQLAGVDDPRLHVVPEPRRGLSAARNTGLAAARGRVVAFTDDDAVTDPDWLRHHLQVYRADPAGAVGAVTGRTVGAAGGSAAQARFEEAGLFDMGEAPLVWAVHRPEPGGPLAALGRRGEPTLLFPHAAGVVGTGNNMSFRTAVLRALGGFDVALGAGALSRGGEDVDTFRQVLVSGLAIVYTPEARVHHHHRASHEDLRDQMFGYGVGMAAVMTKVLLGGGRSAAGLALAVPFGLWTLLSSRSPFGATRRALPSDVVWRERAGYLAGPFLYLRSTAAARREREGR